MHRFHWRISIIPSFGQWSLCSHLMVVLRRAIPLIRRLAVHPLDQITQRLRRLTHSDSTITPTPFAAREFMRRDNELNGMGAGGLALEHETGEQQRTEAALAARTRQLEAIRGVTEEITRELNVTALLQLITTRAAELVGVSSAITYLWDEMAQALIPHTWHGLGDWMHAVRFGHGEGLPGEVMARREAIIVNDYPTSPYVSALFIEHSGITAAMGAPLLYRDRALGVITLNNGGTERRFSEQDRDLLSLFAAQAALAIRNASLYAAETEARRMAEAEIVERQRTEVQLTAAMARLERSNHELQDFVYLASHDLQEPLRKIQAFGDRLHSTCGEMLNERGRDYLVRMQQAAARMQTQINDLLAFSRITTKAQPFRPVDLAQVAREVIAGLEITFQQRGGRVVVEGLPVIDADPLQMRQLLQNLLGNALKFHRPEAAPVVKVSCDDLPARDPDSPLCQFIVEDNGIGFDERYLDRIFVPFQRLHARGEYGGTGIGLAICRKIAERHGGCITARSTPGQGARFIVTLPRTQPKGESVP